MEPFQAYLAATNEKQLVGKVLAEEVANYSISKAGVVKNILDLGCGSGEVSLQIIQALDKTKQPYEYDALDISKESLNKFKAKTPTADLTRIKFWEQKFDENYKPIRRYNILIACQFLYYFQNAQEIIEKLLSMSDETIIVHHGFTGLEEFENEYADYVSKSVYGNTTYADIQSWLNKANEQNNFEIKFKQLACDVNIQKCKDFKSEEGRALLSFFVGSDVATLPLAIQKEMPLFLERSYPDIIQRQQGIFFIRRKIKV